MVNSTVVVDLYVCSQCIGDGITLDRHAIGLHSVLGSLSPVAVSLRLVRFGFLGLDLSSKGFCLTFALDGELVNLCRILNGVRHLVALYSTQTASLVGFSRRLVLRISLGLGLDDTGESFCLSLIGFGHRLLRLVRLDRLGKRNDRFICWLIDRRTRRRFRLGLHLGGELFRIGLALDGCLMNDNRVLGRLNNLVTLNRTKTTSLIGFGHRLVRLVRLDRLGRRNDRFICWLIDRRTRRRFRLGLHLGGELFRIGLALDGCLMNDSRVLGRLNNLVTLNRTKTTSLIGFGHRLVRLVRLDRLGRRNDRFVRWLIDRGTRRRFRLGLHLGGQHFCIGLALDGCLMNDSHVLGRLNNLVTLNRTKTTSLGPSGVGDRLSVDFSFGLGLGHLVGLDDSAGSTTGSSSSSSTASSDGASTSSISASTSAANSSATPSPS